MVVEFLHASAPVASCTGLPVGAGLPAGVSFMPDWRTVISTLAVICPPVVSEWVDRAGARFRRTPPPSFSHIKIEQGGDALTVQIPRSPNGDPDKHFNDVTRELLDLQRQMQGKAPGPVRFELPDEIEHAVLLWGRWKMGAYSRYIDYVLKANKILTDGDELSERTVQELAQMKNRISSASAYLMSQFDVWTWVGRSYSNAKSDALSVLTSEYLKVKCAKYAMILDQSINALVEGRQLSDAYVEGLKNLPKLTLHDALHIAGLLARDALTGAKISPLNFNIEEEEVNAGYALIGYNEIEMPFIDSVAAIIRWMANRCVRGEGAEPGIKIALGYLSDLNASRPSSKPNLVLPIAITAPGLVDREVSSEQAIADAMAMGLHDAELEEANLPTWKPSRKTNETPIFTFKFTTTDLIMPGENFSLI